MGVTVLDDGDGGGGGDDYGDDDDDDDDDDGDNDDDSCMLVRHIWECCENLLRNSVGNMTNMI